jgi:cytochrome c oxidase subunit 2
MARVAESARRLAGASMAGIAAAMVSLQAIAGEPARPLQNVLLPGGPQAQHILRMWHLTLAVCTAVFVLILIAFVLALVRGPRAPRRAAARDVPPDLASLSAPERGPHRSVLAGTAASVLLLMFLIVASVMTDRALAQLSGKNALELQVTANQWWWEVRYDGPPSETFVTANEIHVPVGRTVLVRLKSNDVIHSFWVPSLAGKKDLIPGRDATIEFRADKPGVYRGQCAEFCGVEHAWMAFDVVAEEASQYEAWAAKQRSPAPEPSTALQRQGQQVFVSTTCVTCHSIEGTTAGATHGPDLTHLAARRTLAAGTLANSPSELRRWIRDPHVFKPGANMPATNLSDADLDALVAYLETLS